MVGVKAYESAQLRAVTGPVIRPGGFALTDRGVARCRLQESSRVLDIGCGTGAGVAYLRQRYGLAAVGLDLSAALLAEGARTYCGSPLVQGRAEHLPAAGACFSAVLCECVLSLCADAPNVLREAWRVLQPGGHLILTDVYARVPAGAVRIGDSSVACCLRGAVDRPTVESRISAVGFDLVLWEDHSDLLTRLAAQLVWAHGSLDAFWSAVGGPDGADTMKRAGTGQGCSGRPGYYLLVARKKPEEASF
jgi:arsenite methyltransferase